MKKNKTRNKKSNKSRNNMDIIENDTDCVRAKTEIGASNNLLENEKEKLLNQISKSEEEKEQLNSKFNVDRVKK